MLSKIAFYPLSTSILIKIETEPITTKNLEALISQIIVESISILYIQYLYMLLPKFLNQKEL